jgi:hypothetical protein
MAGWAQDQFDLAQILFICEDTWKWRSKARKMLLRDRRAEGRTGAVLGKGKQPIEKVAMTAEERRQTSGKFLISEEDSGHFQVIMGKVS